MKLSDALKLFDENESDAATRKECLITRQEIKNEITLTCNHSFEYDALLKNIFGCQQNYHYHKCPYCRKVISGFIPYCQHPDNNKVGEELLSTIDQSVFKKTNILLVLIVFRVAKIRVNLVEKLDKSLIWEIIVLLIINKSQNKNYLWKIIQKQCCKILKNGNQCKLKCFNHRDRFM